MKSVIMKSKLLSVIIAALISTGLVGCEFKNLSNLDPSVIANTDQKKEGFSEVKLISREIEDPQDSNSMQSQTYAIGMDSRLLLRLASLNEVDPEILDNYPVLMRLKVAELDLLSVAADRFEVCPIMKNWMMLATWEKAHFYKNGDWESRGGDFDEALCVRSLSAAEVDALPVQEKSLCSASGSLCFDLKSILTDLYRVNKKNYGFVLQNHSFENVSVFGDKSSNQPILIWRRLK